MKNYPIIKSMTGVTVLFTAPRSGYVLDYNDDHYATIQYKSDWNEGAFSNVGKRWFKGKCIVVDNDSERDFVRELIFNHSDEVFTEPSVSNAKVFYLNNENHWANTHNNYSIHSIGKKSLHIPFYEIFNTQSSPSVIGFDLAKGSDTTVTTELKGAPVSASVEDRYRASVKVITELLAENERNNGDYILNEQQVWVINELVNTSQFLIDQKTPVTPPIEWKEVHEVKISYTWFQVNPVFVSEVEMFFYDPRPTPPATAPTNGVRQSNLSVINLNSPDYRNNEIGYLCVDDDGVLHPYDPESPMTEVKLCKKG